MEVTKWCCWSGSNPKSPWQQGMQHVFKRFQINTQSFRARHHGPIYYSSSKIVIKSPASAAEQAGYPTTFLHHCQRSGYYRSRWWHVMQLCWITVVIIINRWRHCNLHSKMSLAGAKFRFYIKTHLFYFCTRHSVRHKVTQYFTHISHNNAVTNGSVVRLIEFAVSQNAIFRPMRWKFLFALPPHETTRRHTSGKDIGQNGFGGLDGGTCVLPVRRLKERRASTRYGVSLLERCLRMGLRSVALSEVVAIKPNQCPVAGLTDHSHTVSWLLMKRREREFTHNDTHKRERERERQTDRQTDTCATQEHNMQSGYLLLVHVAK